MKEKLTNITYRIKECFIVIVIKHAFSMLIPLILVGGLAKAFMSFPIASYQNFLGKSGVTWIKSFLQMIDNGTFGIFSVAVVITICISYSMELNKSFDCMVMYIIVSLASFATQLKIDDRNMIIDELGVEGCFSAMIIALGSCYLFAVFQRCKALSLEKYTSSMDRITGVAIQGFIPGMIVIATISLINRLLYSAFGVFNIHEASTYAICSFFEFINVGNGFASGFIYTVLLHSLWFIGIHGSHILETVALDNFAFKNNSQVFSKAFFDVFVVMGGCGVTICVLLIFIIFYRKNRYGQLGKIASFTVIFNMNEILNFGIPIMLNPILFIPFIFTPIICYVISYTCVNLGIVPAMVREVTWTTPVILSGYIATDSIRGSIMQIACILIGILLYYPFLKINKRVEEDYVGEQLQKLVVELKAAEKNNEEPNLLTRTDIIGLTSRMLLQELQQAIDKHELFMVYQPQVNNAGQCIGAEALLRWEHHLYGFIYPPLIVYLAKEGGILENLEEQIFEMAAYAIKSTENEYNGDFKISINITAKSFLWDLESSIEESLKKYCIPARRLWLEITEQEMVIHSDIVLEKINRLKNVGHTMLIDDFGMGHTSLLYLKSSYFSIVKLDGSLVDDVTESKNNQEIIKSIVELGDNLNVRIIAECVENESQRKILSELGCNWYQGYLFSKPISLDQLLNFIKLNNL